MHYLDFGKRVISTQERGRLDSKKDRRYRRKSTGWAQRNERQLGSRKECQLGSRKEHQPGLKEGHQLGTPLAPKKVHRQPRSKKKHQPVSNAQPCLDKESNGLEKDQARLKRRQKKAKKQNTHPTSIIVTPTNNPAPTYIKTPHALMVSLQHAQTLSLLDVPYSQCRIARATYGDGTVV